MKAKWLILAVVALGLVAAPSVGFAAPPPLQNTQSTAFQTAIATSINGELGLYLLGTWDNQKRFTSDTVYTVVHLVNPTSIPKNAYVTYWDSGGNGIACGYYTVPGNGSAIDVRQGPIGSTLAEYGTVKVVVVTDSGNPDLGLVAYRKEVHYLGDDASTPPPPAILNVSEIRLQPVPPKVFFMDKLPAGPDGTPDEVVIINALITATTGCTVVP